MDKKELSLDKNLKSDKEISFETIDYCYIPDNAEVSVTETSMNIIITANDKKYNNLKNYQRKDKNTYINKSTNECENYNINIYKSDESIKNNMKKLKLLITINFHKYHNSIFITLTYGKEREVLDINVIQKDWRKFIRRLKEKHKDLELLYFYKFEQQKNGNWHTHAIIRDLNNKKLNIENEEINKCWKNGFTFTQYVKNGKVDYSYWNSVTNAVGIDTTETLANYMCKTNQLHNVPNGARIYGYSQNIELSKVNKMKKFDALKLAEKSNAVLYKEYTTNVKKNGYIVDKHKKIIFNKPRKKNK